MQKLAIGIDIGGQSSKCGVVTKDGTILEQSVVTSLIDSFDEYIDLLAGTVKELIRKTANQGTVVGIGVGAPNANRIDGTIRYAPNLRWARDAEGNPCVVNFAERLIAATGLHVRITNDANAAARGEHTYGVTRGIDEFIMITLGTGVGSGIITHGRLIYGHDGFAGELGHVCVVQGGRQCNCGLKGCLETYASAMGVARTAREFLQNNDRDSLLRKLDPEKISSKDIYEAAVQGDELAKDVFVFTGRILGHALGDFVKFSSPKAIVLFGGLTKSKEFFHDEMVSAMNENLMQVWKGKIDILYSSLKESDAAILGASAMVW
ncbi:MAG: ROK family protein [Paludibacteraceae bacterium]|nr:ROK family protein [Paludibacteraceae bacterium]